MIIKYNKLKCPTLDSSSLTISVSSRRVADGWQFFFLNVGINLVLSNSEVSYFPGSIKTRVFGLEGSSNPEWSLVFMSSPMAVI